MRFIKLVLLHLLIIILAISSVIFATAWGKYKEALSLIPLDVAAEKIKAQESFTPIEDISETFINAMVAVEDSRFYKHSGINLAGLFRAVKRNIKEKAFKEGGSSITQQLAKNIYFMGDKSFTRKIAEALVAFDIERNFEKKEILELYFNVIYYGSGNYCVGDASMGYFGKKPSELSDYEATLLAGLPNAPSAYSPDTNPTLAHKRQKIVLEAMVREKYMKQKEADKIIAMQK